MSGDPEQLFADKLFPPPAQPVSSDNLFVLNDEMRAFVASRVGPQAARSGLQVGLFEALKNELKIAYDATRTQVAADTFVARSGNCLSLVIMTAAFAKYLNVPVYYRSVYGHDTWSRSSGIVFRSGHVNLQLGSARDTDRFSRDAYMPLLIDFLAPESAVRLYSRPESEQAIIAMYLNNRAAETLVEGDIATAYWWAREAIRTSPAFLSGYNTLGVVYLRHGNLEQAEHSLRYVLEREPGNVNALTNLFSVLTQAGRAAEAAAVRAELAELAPYPPFYYLDQGVTALMKGDYEGALDLLNKELRRMPYDDEVHFAIAVADLRLGDMRHARQHLTLAVENSATRDRRNLYTAKLNYLKQIEAGH